MFFGIGGIYQSVVNSDLITVWIITI